MNVTYELLKDFAGPCATVIAAGAAAYFAWAQKRIAREKLRLDMYHHLRQIYEGTKELIVITVTTTSLGKLNHMRLRDLYTPLDEGRFYLDADLCGHLDHIHKLCEEHFEMLRKADEAARRNQILCVDDRNKEVALISELQKIWADLPKTFESALKFRA
ncbi:MAG: hypothetical protein QOF41_325 [Methylobacteriaceae bacterium]|nr:hypothetical protein [Methylobacteriaceae bacterium]